MPKDVQDKILMQAGVILMQKDKKITCNIFGGKDSCKPLPEDSEFGQTCKGDRQDLKTDCIYYKDAEAKMTINPTDSMSAALGGDFGRMKQHCPQCLRNMQAMWCVQVLPECGSFQESVHSAIFPAIKAIKEEEDAGQPKMVAVAAAVPGLVKAMVSTMSCKEMCRAVVDTCSCNMPGKGLTFGEGLNAAMENNEILQKFHPGLTADKLKTTLFKDLWGTPICDLFTSKDDSSFSGTCDADVIGKDATCSDNSFCDGLDSSKKSVTESAIAGQIAQVILGFVEGSSGLVQTHKSITKAAMGDTGSPSPPPSKRPHFDPSTAQPRATGKAVSMQFTPASDGSIQSTVGSKARSSAGVVFLSALIVIVVGSAAYFAFKWHQSRHVGFYSRGQYDPIQDEGIPLT